MKSLNFLTKKNNVGIDLVAADPNYYGGTDTYINGLLYGIKLKKKINFQIYVNSNYFKNRKLKNYKNINYIVFELNFIKKLIFKLYNRFYPIFSILINNKKYYYDYKIRNFIFSNFKKIVEQNSNYLICPLVNLNHYNIKCFTSVNIHDLQQLHYPKFFSFTENLRRKYLYYNTIKNANHLVASSKFIKKDIIQNYKVIKNIKSKIDIIEEGVDIKKKITKKNKKFKNFFFFPAQMWPHKNFQLVIEGFDKFNKKNNQKYFLIICGKKFKKEKRVNSLIKNTNNCFHLGIIDENLKNFLYTKCIATICPALYESSSLTMLEAFNYRSLVIASDIDPNIEKLQNFSFLIFKKNNTNSFVNCLEKIIKLKNINNIRKKNYESVKKYNWSIIVDKWLKKIL